MSLSGYTVEVTNLSPNATERDLYDFFSFSGAIEHIEIIRTGEYASTAYVTFRDPHALETAVLLSGATIIDQHVCIARWGSYDEDCSFWNRPSHEDNTQSTMPEVNNLNTTPREAVTMTQEVVKTMLAMGYELSKDALIKAKAFDESHHVTATAAAMVADLSNRSGLTDKINAGLNAVTSVDERYHLSATTKAVVSATTRAAANITNSVVSSSYFSAGALLVSDALNKAAKVAADLATHGAKRRSNSLSIMQKTLNEQNVAKYPECN